MNTEKNIKYNISTSRLKHFNVDFYNPIECDTKYEEESKTTIIDNSSGRFTSFLGDWRKKAEENPDATYEECISSIKYVYHFNGEWKFMQNFYLCCDGLIKNPVDRIPRLIYVDRKEKEEEGIALEEYGVYWSPGIECNFIFSPYHKATNSPLTVLTDDITSLTLALIGDWRKEIDDISIRTYEKCLRLFRENYPDFGGPLY